MGTEVLARFVAAGADAIYILTGERSGAALDRKEASLLDHYRNSPEEGKDAIWRTAFAFSKQKAVKKKAA